MCTFPGQRQEVSRARRLVARYLDGSPVTDDAVLLVSELAANACAHSASGRPGGRFVVRVCGNVQDGVYVEVEDEGSSWDGMLKQIESPHGLYLLHTLSTACGTRRAAGGWVTWFRLGPHDA
jgi:anti-sigma regulatory factor (Ser/Thr protein kinase)